ncbi:uncharacterized protein LOC131649725 [Vicia villosa]|uniref:uncharacterized protein LOC131649725 n=1 Tax=Vicia villosa TaxID=3911 RepID=UPI00273CD758|nr:uncharacterized protein LOC131649725 [Vicia villosa]
MDSPAHLKQLDDDSVSVIRVLEMAQVLARGDTASTVALKKAELGGKAAEEKLSKEESTLMASKEKLKKRAEELAKKGEEIEEEKKKLADLRADWEHTPDESEDVAGLKTWREMVEKIESLKLDCLDMAEAGFRRAVDHLKLLNPDLRTDNIGILSKIVDGQVVPEMPVEEEDNE